MDSQLEALVAELTARIKRLEDIEEITKLKAEYCNAMDGGWDRPAHDADRAIKLFVDDASWSAPGIGVASGRDTMYALFCDFRKFPFAFHRITNQVIQIDGERATGEWHVLVPIKFAVGEASNWIGGIYNDEFQRTPAGWKIKSVKFTQTLLSDHHPAWQVGVEKA